MTILLQNVFHFGVLTYMVVVVQSLSHFRLHGLQPSRLLCPWDFQRKIIGVGCHFLLQRSGGGEGGCLPSPGIKLLLHWQVDSLPLRHQKSPTYMVHTCLLYSCNPQAPLFMVFPRKEYWSGLPCPPPGYLPDPGIKTATSVSQISFIVRWAPYHQQHLSSPAVWYLQVKLRLRL